MSARRWPIYATGALVALQLCLLIIAPTPVVIFSLIVTFGAFLVTLIIGATQ